MKSSLGNFLIIALLFAGLFFSNQSVPTIYAQQGCCSWHDGVCGCSRSGRTVCCDGTLSPSCTCGGSYYPSEYYVGEKPTNPTDGSYSSDISLEDWCSYDIVMTWSGDDNATGYDIEMSKQAGQLNNPIFTSTRSYEFKNKEEGLWYINLRARSGMIKSDEIVYWTIELPKIKPFMTIDINKNVLNYKFACMDEIIAPVELVDQFVYTRGEIRIPYKYSTNIKIEGVDVMGKKHESTGRFLYIEPEPSKSQIALILEKYFDEIVALGILILILLLTVYGPKKEQVDKTLGVEEGKTVRQKKLLIVENDKFLNDLFSELLTDEGYIVDSSFDGLDALNKINNGQYDLVYLRILMPKLDGIEILQRINPNVKEKSKIIIFTNLDHEAVIKQAFILGAKGYEMLFGMTPDEVIERIKGYMTGKITPQQSEANAIKHSRKDLL